MQHLTTARLALTVLQNLTICFLTRSILLFYVDSCVRCATCVVAEVAANASGHKNGERLQTTLLRAPKRAALAECSNDIAAMIIHVSPCSIAPTPARNSVQTRRPGPFDGYEVLL